MQKLTENYVVSNAKIKAALGITQMPVRAKDGLMETIKSFCELKEAGAAIVRRITDCDGYAEQKGNYSHQDYDRR